MYGYIEKGNSQVAFYLTVSGYPSRGYLYYSFREAVKLYREEFGLKYKRIDWHDWR